MISDDLPILLDTNILIHVIRRSELGAKLIEDFELLTRPEPCLISYVTIGELEALAARLEWGEQKREFIDTIRMNMVVVPIERTPILKSYAAVDLCAHRAGRILGKNDLWIAATAVATESGLLTTDRDFYFDELIDSLLPELALIDTDTGQIVQ